jgi:phosphoglycerate dehydrogenase-like enzyme
VLLVYHGMADAYRTMLAERFPGLDVVAVSTEAALERHIGDAEILLAWRFPLHVLARARRLRWLQLTSAGADHVLGAGAHLRGVVVTNARGIHAGLMADYVMGVLVMLQWNFPRLWRNQQTRTWRHQFTEPLAGKTLGVVGLGAIGGEIARRGAAFGMDVVGLKRAPHPVEGVRRVFGPDGLGEMLPLCDFAVLVVPATPATRGMLGERELGRLRPTAYLVNVARGSVVDEEALVRALREGRLAGAALDVFETEPLPAASPLWEMEQVIVTPHIAGEPGEYASRVMEVFGENLARWLDGRPLRNVVDLARGY